MCTKLIVGLQQNAAIVNGLDPVNLLDLVLGFSVNRRTRKSQDGVVILSLSTKLTRNLTFTLGSLLVCLLLAQTFTICVS